MAQVQYNIAIEHLKPIGDNLWLAGALEGLCAVGMCRHDHFSNLSSMRPKSMHQRPLGEHLSNGGFRKSHSQESDMLGHSTSSSLDLASSKSHHPIIISSTDCCNYALETMELYNKVELNPYLFEEFKFKVIRLLITESQKRKACEILDSLITSSLSRFCPEDPCSVKRYLTIVHLYKAMNFNRKASLALWLLTGPHDLNLVDFEHDTLLTELIYSPNENRRPSSAICRLITNPPLWSPLIVLNQVNSPTRITTTTTTTSNTTPGTIMHTGAGLNATATISSSLTGVINKFKSLHYITRYLSSTVNSHLNNLYASKSSIQFRSVGWCELQLSVMHYFINQYKTNINLEDTSEISWDNGLKLIGYCFSVLDSWPEYTDEASCISCMDDLCRLAVLRCPDQPVNAPSMTILNYQSSSGRSRRWPRSHRVIYSNGYYCYYSNGNNEGIHTKANERQMLDLVEIPVHQLPLVRSIIIPPLPSHLIPHSISKNAAESVVPLSKSRVVVIRADRSQSKQSDTAYSAEFTKPSGPFVYNPFQTDSQTNSKNSTVDWVCEEPGYIELIVDNKLPMDLRISGVHVELMPITGGGLTKEPSPNRISFTTSDYDSSFSNNTMNGGCSDNLSSLIHLEAICLVVETPQTTKILSTKQLGACQSEDTKHQSKENGFSGQLENNCLLEEADLRRQFPNSNAECFWRKATVDVNCKLPSRTNGIKLSIGVIPTVDMLFSGTSSDEPNPCAQYRVVGITYRLVDCGGMRVCLRPPFKYIYSMSSCGVGSGGGGVGVSGELPHRGGHERHPSCSSTSTLSTVRSSWTFGSEPIFSSINASGAYEFDNEHLLSNALGIQFSLLPMIRLQPAMPRLCIFPGRICSAFDLTEAMNILKDEVDVKHTCDLTKQMHNLGLSRFRVPDPSKWSNRVAAVLDLSIFPYETRWLPIELYIRDENRINIPMVNKNNADNSSDNDNPINHNDHNYSNNSNNTNSPENIYDCDGYYCSLKRHLNLLHVNVKSVSTSLSLLTKLNLTAADFIQCIGIEDIRKKFPLPVENYEVPGSLPNDYSDFDEHLLPLYATHVGVIWLRFDSDKYWQTVTNRLSTDPELNDLVKTISVQSIYIELEIEYALDAVIRTPSFEVNEISSSFSQSQASSSSPSPPAVARRISLGFKLKLLSSNCSPLNIHDLMLTFEDEPLTNEDNKSRYQFNSKLNGHLFGENIQAQTFLYGSVEANLSYSFLPQLVMKPEHILNYRLELELKESWNDHQKESLTTPVRLSSQWVQYSLPLRMNSFSRRKSSVSTSSVSFKFSNETTLSSQKSVPLNFDSNELDGLEKMHQIRLPLNGISDLIFNNNNNMMMMKLINTDRLKSNELGIPIPVKSEVPGNVLESNIKIFWFSRLYARCTSLKSPESYSTSDNSKDYEQQISLCSRFRRYGRIILSSHECQIDPKWLLNEKPSMPLAKPWYEYPFLNSGSSVGLLWAHNIWIDISLDPLSEEKSQSRLRHIATKKLDPQSQLCLQCRQELPSSRQLNNMTRRISATSNESQPLGQVKSYVNVRKTEMIIESRKISMPDLRSPQSAKQIDKDDLYTSSRICTYPLNPVSVSIKCGTRSNLFRNIRIQNDSHVTNSDSSNTPQDNPSNASNETIDSTTNEFRIERVWMGPAVYRHVQHISEDDSESTQTTLLGPLIEGIDYAFVGQASGSIGISVPHSPSTPCHKPKSVVSSIVFLRPGKFWVCGLLGVLPQSSELSMTKDGQIPKGFRLPSVHSVETIRYSPNGIYIHVLDSYIH
ncbi:unnamed protein product [Trichobilharzia szidati]|nr:unnamed protein product [Trichobilharzia szidati]